MAVNHNNTGGEVMYYDVAAGVERRGNARSLSSKYSTKDTVNLCIRERKGISFELFFLILAAILIVLLLLEFFGVYRPYLRMEAAEAELAQQQAEIQSMRDSMSDYDKVREDYRQYNYENFPRERVDRQDVFELVEKVVFTRGIITSFSLRENTLSMQIGNVTLEDLTYIPASFEASEIVQEYSMPQQDVRYDETTGRASFGITIVFKNAE